MIRNHSNKEPSNGEHVQPLNGHQEEKTERKRSSTSALNNKNSTAHLTFDSDDDDIQGKPLAGKHVQPIDEQQVVNFDEHPEEKIFKKKRKLKDSKAQLTKTSNSWSRSSKQHSDNHDQEEQEDDNDESTADYPEISMEEEKKKALSILDQITHEKSASNSLSKIKPMPPDANQTLKLPSTPKSILKTNNDPVLNSEMARSYELDKSKLKSMFDKTPKPAENMDGHQPFQFQFFDGEQSTPLPVPRILSAPPSKSSEWSRPFQQRFDQPARDEDDEGYEGYEARPTPDEIERERQRKNETFFFFDIDDRLQEGLDSFVRTEEIGELERGWPTKRKEIGEALRTKHRKAIQRKDKHRIFNHRRRQQFQSSSHSKPKSDTDGFA